MKTNLFLVLAAGAALVASPDRSVAAISLTYSGTGFGTSPVDLIYPTDYSGGVAARGSLFLGELIVTPAAGPSLRTYCLSPAGTVGSGQFDLMTFEAAKFGNNPSTWSHSGGIENAAYLFHNFAGSVANNDQGAAMQLALMELLYDSTGLGTVSGGGLSLGRFQATGAGASAAVVTAANNYINDILAAGAANIATFYAAHPGHVLRPRTADGQDLITFMVPVPEAGTILAGAFLLPAAALLLRRSIPPRR